jgi:hypothetical protein
MAQRGCVLREDREDSATGGPGHPKRLWVSWMTTGLDLASWKHAKYMWPVEGLET